MDLDGKHLYKLVFNVLYPGVLGATLITYLTKDIPLFFESLLSGAVNLYPRFYFGLVFIFHWSLLFVIFTESFEKNQFRKTSFISYSLLSLFMLSAFYSLPIKPTTGTEYLHFYLSVTGIAAPFVVLDLYRQLTPEDKWAHPFAHNIHEHIIDFSLFVWGIGFSIAHEISPVVHGNSFVVHIFITGTLIASLFTINEHT